MSDVWGNYWEKGHSTTFGEYYSDGYTHGYIAKWLKDIIEQRSGEKLNLFEVGCGNASLLPCLFDLNVKGSYVGIDAAKVGVSESAIRRNKKLLDVELISETPIERFKPERQFDLVLSIYGIEYSNTDQSLSVIKNCVKSGGQVFFLMHHADSYICEQSKKAITEFEFEKMQKAVSKLRSLNTELDKLGGDVEKLPSSGKAEKSRAFLNKFIAKIMNQAADKRNPVMVDFCSIVLVFFKRIKGSKDERKKHIDSIMPDFVASKERFLQMVNVAKNEKEIDIFKSKMEASGFKNVIIKPVITERGPVAWSVQAD